MRNAVALAQAERTSSCPGWAETVPAAEAVGWLLDGRGTCLRWARADEHTLPPWSDDCSTLDDVVRLMPCVGAVLATGYLEVDATGEPAVWSAATRVTLGGVWSLKLCPRARGWVTHADVVASRSDEDGDEVRPAG